MSDLLFLAGHALILTTDKQRLLHILDVDVVLLLVILDVRNGASLRFERVLRALIPVNVVDAVGFVVVSGNYNEKNENSHSCAESLALCNRIR